MGNARKLTPEGDSLRALLAQCVSLRAGTPDVPANLAP